MFLRNYDNRLLAQHIFNGHPYGYSSLVTVSISTNVFGDGYCNIKAGDGGIKPVTIVASGTTPVAVNFSKSGLCFGDGNVPVTYNDYRLSGNIVPNNTKEISREISYDAATRKHKITVTLTYTNTGDMDITISEWGIWSQNPQTTNVSGSLSEWKNNANVSLMYREVLDEPIVIKVGTTSTFTLTLEIPIPLHL